MRAVAPGFKCPQWLCIHSKAVPPGFRSGAGPVPPAAPPVEATIHAFPTAERKTSAMAIQWFPGHMHLTKKAIAERVKDIDVVIELLDARLPGSSANPMLAELTGHKPGLKVLNKQDLADPDRTSRWLAHYNAQPATRAISLDAGQTAPARQLVDACHELAPQRGGLAKPMRVLICGIPNVASPR